jgi:hypothetical protein
VTPCADASAPVVALPSLEEVDVNSRFLLGGIALFAAGAALPSIVSRARAGDGAWQCYVVDRMPDMKAASEWKGAINYATGLNEVAAQAAPGTIITTTYPAGGGMYAASSGAPILCVKK